ncbi:MAG: DUF188 domain-containing protein [Planctomycetaceae bacterium]|nr:DUF188 domain-containing protein [Planctomycetaceae bacterium]
MATPHNNTDTPQFTVWVDADACPRQLRDILEIAALRRRVTMRFVANSYMRLENSPYLHFHQVAEGADKADDFIVEHAAAGDLAISGDIPLAARLVEKDVMVIDTHGEQLDSASIGERLAMRNLMDSLRSGGMDVGGPRELDRTGVQQFANALDRYLTRRGK